MKIRHAQNSHVSFVSQGKGTRKETLNYLIWCWRNVCLMLMTADNGGTGCDIYACFLKCKTSAFASTEQVQSKIVLLDGGWVDNIYMPTKGIPEGAFMTIRCLSTWNTKIHNNKIFIFCETDVLAREVLQKSISYETVDLDQGICQRIKLRSIWPL